MERIPMTPKGYETVLEELRNLKHVERASVIRAIAEAREHGDLSENAEYHAARERQSFIEGRIGELETLTSRVEVIDPSEGSGPEIRFGASVVLEDCESDEKVTYQVVGEYEADIDKGLISIRAPLSRAMIGKVEGDVFELVTPSGTREYEILEVRYG
jgi:transcription elongation factor GreA